MPVETGSADPFIGDVLERQERPRGGRPAKRKGRTTCKYFVVKCAGCGARLRGARSSFAAGFPTCACGGVFSPADEHAIRALEPELGEALEAREAGEALERATARELADDSSGFSKRHNCFVCGRFKSSPAAECDYCGDIPTTHGADLLEVTAFNREHGARA